MKEVEASKFNSWAEIQIQVFQVQLLPLRPRVVNGT